MYVCMHNPLSAPVVGAAPQTPTRVDGFCSRSSLYIRSDLLRKARELPALFFIQGRPKYAVFGSQWRDRQAGSGLPVPSLQRQVISLRGEIRLRRMKSGFARRLAPCPLSLTSDIDPRGATPSLFIFHSSFFI